MIRFVARLPVIHLKQKMELGITLSVISNRAVTHATSVNSAL